MELTRKDAAATVATALAVVVFAACHESWNVPLVGDSVRWAAAAILVLGMVGCVMGRPGQGAASLLLGVLGAGALAFAIVALVTASLTALSLLTTCVVLLWLASTVRHAWPHRTVTA